MKAKSENQMRGWASVVHRDKYGIRLYEWNGEAPQPPGLDCDVEVAQDKCKWVERYRVQGGHDTYTAALNEQGRWGCSCPAWKFKRASCSHMRFANSVRSVLSPTLLNNAEFRVGVIYLGEPALSWVDESLARVERLVGKPFAEWVLISAAIAEKRSARYSVVGAGYFVPTTQKVGLPRDAAACDVQVSLGF